MTSQDLVEGWKGEYGKGTNLETLCERIQSDLVRGEPMLPAEVGATALRFFVEFCLRQVDRASFEAILRRQLDCRPYFSERPDGIHQCRQRKIELEQKIEALKQRRFASDEIERKRDALKEERTQLRTLIDRFNHRESFG